MYAKNEELLAEVNDGEIPAGTVLGQQPDLDHFVPGMLSIDFLKSMTKVEALNWCLSIPGIGVKTASCFLAFHLKFQVFAVDTHAYKAVKWLGHVPEKVRNEDAAFVHADARYPEELKNDLHQAFWHHMQTCDRCSRARHSDDIRDGEDACCIEHLLDRSTPLRSPPRKAKVIIKEKNVVVKKTTLPMWRQHAFFKGGAEEARLAGYELEEVPEDDDFDAGSVNVSVKLMWRRIEVEEQVPRNGNEDGSSEDEPVEWDLTDEESER